MIEKENHKNLIENHLYYDADIGTPVKDFGTDEKGQPTINGRPILKFRIKKLMPVKENKKMSNNILETYQFNDVSAGEVFTYTERITLYGHLKSGDDVFIKRYKNFKII